MESCIKVNTRELNKEFYTGLSILYILKPNGLYFTTLAYSK